MERTPNYGLPVYAADDVVNPMDDTNTAFEAVDTELKSLADAAAGGFGVVKDVQELQAKMTAAEASINALQSEVTEMSGEIASLQADVTTLMSRTYTMYGNGEVKYVASGD